MCVTKFLANDDDSQTAINRAPADGEPDPERSTGCRDAARQNGDRSEEAVRRSATGQ
jgi:hypothetical protein